MSAEIEPNHPSRIDQILEMAAQGRTDKEIASELGISTHTVATYWKRLRERLGVPNRAAALTRMLQIRIDQQNRQLQEAHTELQKLHRIRQGEMSALLSHSQRRVVELEARVRDLNFLDRASQIAHATAYELQSVQPVAYRYLSASAAQFGIDVRSLLAGEITFYEQIFPEDLALIYEKSLDARWLPHERYLFLYRLQMPEPRWVFDTHQGVHYPDGSLAGVLGIAIDVHELVDAGLLTPTVSRIVVPAEPLALASPLP